MSHEEILRDVILTYTDEGSTARKNGLAALAGMLARLAKLGTEPERIATALEAIAETDLPAKEGFPWSDIPEYLFRLMSATESIGRSLLEIKKTPEPIYFVAEGLVNLDDFPPGANIVRCHDPRMAVLNGTNDQHLASIADSLAKLANPPVEVKADTNPRTRDGRTKIKELLGRSDGIVAFKCLDCAKETQIPLVNFVEEPSRWVPVECAHCHRKYELEGKRLS